MIGEDARVEAIVLYAYTGQFLWCDKCAERAGYPSTTGAADMPASVVPARYTITEQVSAHGRFVEATHVMWHLCDRCVGEYLRWLSVNIGSREALSIEAPGLWECDYCKTVSERHVHACPYCGAPRE